jgi:GT2 family glycosyltransferase
MPVRVSVIVPMYKASAWIEATLESVVRQTYPADCIEVIAVDDASPDDSAAVARAFFAKHWPNGRVVQQEKNGGVPVARNAGWRMASGDWIQFLDQDDLLAPHKIALQAAVAAGAAPDVAVVYSNWQHLLLEDGKWQASGPINAPFVDDDPLLQILEQFSFGYVGPTLIRRSFLEQIGGFDLKPNLGEDTELMLRLARSGGCFREARSLEAAFLYRQSPGSLWRSYIKNPEAMRNLLHTFRSVEEHWRKQGGPLSQRQRQALASRYSRFADLYLEHDPATYWLLKGWLKELGFARPIGLTPRVEALSRFIGYENATRVRSRVRKLGARLRGQRE